MFRLNFCRYWLFLVVILIPLMVWSNPSVYQLRVDGIVCPFCGYGIEKKLKTVRGVEEIKLDISEGVITVTTAEGTTLTESNMRQIVRDAGFTLSGFKKNKEDEKIEEEKETQDE